MYSAFKGCAWVVVKTCLCSAAGRLAVYGSTRTDALRRALMDPPSNPALTCILGRSLQAQKGSQAGHVVSEPFVGTVSTATLS